MIFTNEHKNLKLVIDDILLKKMSIAGIEHYPNEFGGFLIGKYSSDLRTLYVECILVPEKYSASFFSFERSLDGIENEFKKIFKEKNLYYVGEWHTHPKGSSMYSNTDLQTMTSIAESETVRINNPILLILGISAQREISSSFYLYDNLELKQYVKDYN